MYFSQFRELGSSRSRCRSSVGPLSVEGCLFTLTTRGGRARALSQTSFMRALIPLMRLHLHDLSVSQRRHLLISLWALRFQHMVSGGHKHTLGNLDIGDPRHCGLGDSFYCYNAIEVEVSFCLHLPASFSADLSPPEALLHVPVPAPA